MAGRLQHGDRFVPAALINEHTDGLEGLAASILPDGAPGSAGGLILPPPGDVGTDTILARLTAKDASTPPLYSWERVAEDADGDTSTHPDTGHVGGGPGAYPAVEDNGHDVPLGSVVRLFPALGPAYWRFSWPPLPEAATAEWRFDATSTGMADPGSGKFRADNASLAAAANLALSRYTGGGTDVAAVLRSLRAGDGLRVQDEGNSTNWVRYALTGTPADNGTWFGVPVALYQSGSYGGATPANNTPCVLTFGMGGGGGAGGGITSINALTSAAQTLVTATGGTDFTITSSGSAHTFALPTAGTAVSRGLITNGAQTLGGKKRFADDIEVGPNLGGAVATVYGQTTSASFAVAVVDTGSGTAGQEVDLIFADNSANSWQGFIRRYATGPDRYAFSTANTWGYFDGATTFVGAFGTLADGSTVKAGLITSLGTAGGTVFLKGSGAPTGATGAVNNYYEDVTAGILYGPKGSVEEHPTVTLAPDTSGNFALGVRWKFLKAGKITRLRYQRLAGSTATLTFNVWDGTTGSSLASVTDTQTGLAGTFEVVLPTPVSVAANDIPTLSVSAALAPYLNNSLPPVTNSTNVQFQQFVFGAAGSRPTTGSASGVYVEPIFGPDDSWPVTVRIAPQNAIILNGTAPPTGSDGSAGYYYEDTAASVLYGPKVTSSAEEYLNLAGPVSGNNTSEVGHRIKFLAAGNVVRLRYYRQSTSGTVTTLHVWTDAGALLATVTSTQSAAGYYEVPLTPPIAVAANDILRISYSAPSPGVSERFNVAPTASPGPNVQLADAHGYYATAGSFPATSYDSTYYAEPIFQAGANPWPTTVRQLPANAVDNSQLRDSAACSVLGRSANSTGDPADIALPTAGQVLMRSATALVPAYPFPGPNILNNGGFSLAQRFTPAVNTAVANGAYGLDRWKVYRENADLTCARGDNGTTRDPNLYSLYFGQFGKTTSAGKFLICQPSEATLCYSLTSLTLTLRVKMRTVLAARTVRLGLIYNTGSGTNDVIPAVVSAWNGAGVDPTLGTNLAYGGVVSCSLTTSWQLFSVTFTVPVNARNLVPAVWTDSQFPAGEYLQMGEALMAEGSIPRPWIMTPTEVDKHQCERFFEKSYDTDAPPGTVTQLGCMNLVSINTTDLYYETCTYRTSKRVTSPVVSVYSTQSGAGGNGATGAGKCYNPSAGVDVRLDTGNNGQNGFKFGLNGNRNSVDLIWFHYTAEAEL